jgi:hypothetical protein
MSSGVHTTSSSLFLFVKLGDIRRIRPSYFSYGEERYLGYCLSLQEEMSLLRMREVFNLRFYNQSSCLTTDCGEEERL